MQLKLEHMMLSITDEISMVGFKQFQSMNQTMCALKGTTDGNWGDICVLAVGDLYQLPPVGQCPKYMPPQTMHTLNDIAPNRWGENAVTCTDTKHETKEYEICKLPEQNTYNCTTCRFRRR